MDLKPSSEQISNTTKKLDILSTLDDTNVKKHFKEMFRIGTINLHESAFAVYNQSGKPKVSDLIFPEITDFDLSSEESIKQHNSITISRLIRNPTYIESPMYDVKDYMGSGISEAVRKTIEYISNNPYLENDEKKNNIADILINEHNNRLGISKYRSDIDFIFHNHPQNPGMITDPYNILLPSLEDLDSYSENLKSNPDLIEGIVASNGQEHKLILYKAKSISEIKPGQYETMLSEGNKSTRRKLGILAICGYNNIILGLNKNGEIDETYRKNINDTISVLF